MRLRFGALACAIAFAQFAGCAGHTPYANKSAKNVSIRSATSSKGILTSVHARLHIYDVDTECRAKYAGTVKLDKPSLTIGIPTERWSYLAFDFASSSFPAGRSGHMSHEMFFKPETGHRYEIEVTYRDEIYNVVLGERRRDGTLRELPPVDPPESYRCTSQRP